MVVSPSLFRIKRHCRILNIPVVRAGECSIGDCIVTLLVKPFDSVGPNPDVSNLAVESGQRGRFVHGMGNVML